jgi:hypothetical protein
MLLLALVMLTILDCIVFHLYDDFRRAVHAARRHGINLEGLRRSPVAGQEFVRDSPEQGPKKLQRMSLLYVP